jgi:Ni/Co efflux regulator RcnB
MEYFMTHAQNIGLPVGITLILVMGMAAAVEPAHEEHSGARPVAAAPQHAHGGARPALRQAEPHPGPKGYQRLTEPKGWDARPSTADRSAYQHNFQAARSYKIGPYHRPAGWRARNWAYGQRLPRAYWASQYILADYWLFALEVPPAGYEWVRVGDDAILVSITNGEILQVEYGVFA